MKNFEFNLFIVTEQGQQFKVGTVTIKADNLEDAQKDFNKRDLPYHTKAIIVQY